MIIATTRAAPLRPEAVSELAPLADASCRRRRIVGCDVATARLRAPRLLAAAAARNTRMVNVYTAVFGVFEKRSF